MTIPLKRQPAPKWTAEVKQLDKTLHVTAQRGELPEGTTFDFRLNSESVWPLISPGSDFSNTVPGEHDPMMLTWGNHTVTVTATLPDKRAYQRPIDLTIDGGG